jgi:hypothetical protein
MTHTELLTALRDDTLRVVPAEPTQEMDDALEALPNKYGCNFVQLSAPEIWPALCAASPDHTAALLDYIAGLERDRDTQSKRVVAIGGVAINSLPRNLYTVPPAQGVFACAENPNALTVVFKSRPTDDDLRSLHEIMRMHARAAGKNMRINERAERADASGMGDPTMDMGYAWRDNFGEDVTHWMPIAAAPSLPEADR